MPKTYCDLPFNHQYIHMSGTVRLCCATLENINKDDGKEANLRKDNLDDLWNNEHMKQARLDMKNGKVLSACSKCIQQEARGYGSSRVTMHQTEYLKILSPDGSMPIKPKSMELHFGNLCNLKCKMCGQDYSNQVGKEILDIGKTDKDFLDWVKAQSGNVNNWTNDLSIEYDWFKNEKVKNRLIKFVSDNILELTVIGGEPTVIPQFFDLLDFCYQNKTLRDKDVTIVTNLTNINPKMTDWLPEMSNWQIWASLDGLGDVTEYIRYPSKFDKVKDNLNFYKSLINQHGNGKITFSPAVQLLNIHQLDEMLKWFIDFAEGRWGDGFAVSWMSQVWYPRICNYDVAPESYRLQVADKLEKSSAFFSRFPDIKTFYEKQIENLRKNFLDKDEEAHLQKAFIRYNDKQDQHRTGQSWRKLLPDLENALTKTIK